MKLSELKQSGHWPTLLSAFLYFDISFMAWVSLGPLIAYIAKEMNIPIEQKLTLVAIPVLSGAILRIPLGIMADTIGSKLTGALGQAVVALACAYVWLFGLSGPAPSPCLARSSAWAAPPSPSRCRRRAAGIRRTCKAW